MGRTETREAGFLLVQANRYRLETGAEDHLLDKSQRKTVHKKNAGVRIGWVNITELLILTCNQRKCRENPSFPQRFWLPQVNYFQCSFTTELTLMTTLFVSIHGTSNVISYCSNTTMSLSFFLHSACIHTNTTSQ